MKRTRTHLGKAGVYLLLGFASTCGASVATSQTPMTPYHGIVERNVFDLRTLVVADKLPSPSPIALPKITLTGITTIFGRTIAFITIASDKPGQPPESVMLVEGQALHEIEVKTIDYKSGIVQVFNHGQAQTLDFEHDGAKASAPPLSPCISVTSFPPASRPLPKNGASLSPEEQVALIEIQREKFRMENDPIGHILPPTEMSDEGVESVSP